MPRPGLTIVITPDPDHGYTARFAGTSLRVGRGETEGAAVDDLVGRAKRPGKGFHGPAVGKVALDPETDEG